MKNPLRSIKGSLTSDRIDLLIKISFGVLIAVGCYMVVRPFLTSILISAMLCVVTWPFFLKIDGMLKGRRALSSALMVAIIAVIIIIPLTLLMLVSAQQLSHLIFILRDWYVAGMPLPEWMSSLPLVGTYLHEPLGKLIKIPEVSAAIRQMATRGTSGLITSSLTLANILIQILLIAAVAFIFYGNGEALARKVRGVLDKVGGNLSSQFNSILVNTTRSVVFGIFGTAFGQAFFAYIGFWICGISNKMLLSFLVFILSMVPMGPPLVWAPIAVGLYLEGNVYLATFLVLWGVLVVSSVDNFLKPMLISRGTPLPMALVFLGVFGGMIAFGFLGILLGPILLSLGSTIFAAWLSRPPSGDDSEQDSGDLPPEVLLVDTPDEPAHKAGKGSAA